VLVPIVLLLYLAALATNSINTYLLTYIITYIITVITNNSRESNHVTSDDTE